jgi:NADH-quinone oxidoreductase subunit N
MQGAELVNSNTPMVVILAASVLAMLASAGNGGKGWVASAFIAFLGFAAAFVLELLLSSGVVPLGTLTRGAFPSFASAVVYLAGALSVPAGIGYMRFTGAGEKRGEYHALMLLSAAGMSAMVAANDMLAFLIGLELASLPLYVLSAFRRGNRYSVEAGLKYFIIGAFGTALMVFGIALIYGFASASRDPLSFAAIGATAAAPGSHAWLLAPGLALFLSGMAFKLGLVPFHMWLPDVYQGAPTPVTAFMAAGIKAAVVWALMRILVYTVGFSAGHWWTPLCFLAVATMVVGNVAALVQGNIKRMLAYSSMAHTGYILSGLLAAGVLPSGPLSTEAAASVGYYLAVYAMMTVAAFTVAGMTESGDGRGVTMKGVEGLSRRRPGVALALAVTMFSLAGMPPTAGFFAKFYVFKAAVNAGLYWLAVIGVLNSLVSFYYYLRVLVHAYMESGDAERGTDEKPPIRVDVFSAACLAVAVGALLWLGIFPSQLSEAAVRAVASIAGGGR